jgi:DNA-binding transcriptional LysR family regulator
MLVSELCLNFEMVAVVRKQHPRIRDTITQSMLELEEYVAVHDFAYRTHDRELRELMDNANARARVEVPNALMLPVILEDSDLVALIPRVHADMMAKRYELGIYSLPMLPVVSHASLIWHRAYEKDPSLSWFRETCITAFREIRLDLEKLYPDIPQ